MMETSEKIKCKEQLQIFQQLVDERRLVQFQIREISMDGLTFIRAIRKDWGTHYFLIDVPEGLWANITNPKKLFIEFEFTGSDKLPYRFKSIGSKKIRNEIWLLFPKYVERIQLREHFRIEVRTKAKFLFGPEGARLSMKVINFSEGGALAEFHPPADGLRGYPMVKPNKTLGNCRLILTSRVSQLTIRVKRSRLVRVTEDPSVQRYFCALQFVEMAGEEKNKLTQLIYNMQREFLRKRLPGQR